MASRNLGGASAPPSSRAYIKRKYTLNKSDGPTVYFSEIILKRMIKHAWPAVIHYSDKTPWNFHVSHKFMGLEPGLDFWDALQTCVRICAYEYRINATTHQDCVTLHGRYLINASGKFRVIK